MKYLHQVVSLLLVFLLVSLTACGGGGGGGSNNVVSTLTLSGTVVDSTGVAVPGATVTIASDPVVTQTDADGVFSVRIDAGSHHLSAERDGVVFLDMDFSGDAGSDLDLGSLTPTTYYLNQGVPTAKPLYGINGRNWNDYVVNDNTGVFDADDNACLGTETGGYSACIHGGEMRAVEVPGYSNCTDLTATDALGAFDWTCQVINGQAVMISTGLKDTIPVTGAADGTAAGKLVNSSASFVSDGVEAGDTVVNTSDYTVTTVTSVDSETQLTVANDIFVLDENYSITVAKNLADLLDFSTPGWKNNSVTVKDGSTMLYTTAASTWWNNPVVTDNDGGLLAETGTVYLITGSPNFDYTFDANKVALVVKPGITSSQGEIQSDGEDFLWIEGKMNANNLDVGVYFRLTHFSVLRGVQITGNANSNIYLYDNSSNNLLKNIIATNSLGEGVVVTQGSDYNTLDKIVAAGNLYGIDLDESSNNTLTNITAVDNDGYGVWFSSAWNNNLSNVIAEFNGEGIFLDNSSGNTLSDISTANNNNAGIQFNDSSNNTVSDLVSLADPDTGVSLNNSSDNHFTNITSSNNGYAGFYLGNSSGNSLSNIATENNSVGVLLEDSLNNDLSNVIASSNEGGIFLRNSSGNRLSRVIVANNDNGIDLYNSSSNNSLSDITTTNNSNAGIYLNFSDNNTLSNVTAANNSYGVYIEVNSDNNTLSNTVAVNNRDGIELVNASNNTLSNIAAANNDYGVYLQESSSDNYITGLLRVGSNASFDCYVTMESTDGDLQDDAGPNDAVHSGLCLPTALSDFTPKTGVTLASSFVGKVGTGGLVDTTEDGENPEDDATPGTALYPADPRIFDWTSFENTYRGWGIDGSAFPNSNQRGQWATGMGRIWDWSLALGDVGDAGGPVIQGVLDRRLIGDVANTITHTWSDSSPAVTYLRNAMEIMDDGIGNDNGLCETDETCLYTPNIGSYQGHGALQSAGTFTDGDAISGVTLLEYEANGY